MRTNSLVMTRRTYEADAEHIETADDLDDLVHDKREGWRANSSKARRRQRRYKKRLTNELLRMGHLDEEWTHNSGRHLQCFKMTFSKD